MIPLRVKFRCYAFAWQEFSEVGIQPSKNTQTFGLTPNPAMDYSLCWA